MAPEIGSLRALANGESQFVGSSSGVFFINTVRRAFSTAEGTEADDGRHAAGADTHDDPSPEDCIVGDNDRNDPESSGERPGCSSASRANYESDAETSPMPSGMDIMTDMSSLPDYTIARDLFLTYFRIWHPLVPFLQGPECLADLENLYAPDFNRRSSRSLCQFVIFKCILNVAKLDTDGPLDLGSAAIRSPSDLLPTLSMLALRCDTISIQALLASQVYFVSTMALRHASSVSGLLSKSIFQSGMHRCPVRYDHLSPDERSMRKRTFWSFYVLDRFISQSLGHPNGIQDSDIDVCPPGQRDLHEPVAKSDLHGQVENTFLHLPANHPERLASSPAGQDQTTETSPEVDEEPGRHERASTDPPPSSISPKAAAILRHRRETQAVLEHHVRHSQLVGRVLEVFHKSIHAREMDNQTILFLKADVTAYGNDLTEPRFTAALQDIPQLTPDPTVFPFVSYYYTILLLNRPSLSLDSRRAEFRDALQTCINAAYAILRIIEQYSEAGGPLFWPGYMSAVWMSGLVLALAARLKVCNVEKAISGIESSLQLLNKLTKRWAMARHCREVLSVLLQGITQGPKTHKRVRKDTIEGSDYEDGQDAAQKSAKRSKRRMASANASGRQDRPMNLGTMSPRRQLPISNTNHNTKSPIPAQRSRDSNPVSRVYESQRQNLFNFETSDLNPNSPRLNQSQARPTDASQIFSPPDFNFQNNTSSMGSYFAPIPTTFPDRNRNSSNQGMDRQFGVADNFFDMFDGATWGSLLDIVNDAGAEAQYPY
ncbi:Zn(II)2Cys6 transcription factor [Colletotrichum scovillei]|uniref:Zn(II)2Cys6 transcription factor n=1 Tax=Colletotrichum scovillei TaxID=1209932 RepID=A0A9P7QUN9_9PEZI|nr:Zn(II)2Cys6 transcription factor [Colletotrichum scovillei]KAF4774799.1 Zn(II)2Cys6 transcription factor [Colletotrichum scovillei]KAG7039701.1 Zn(II)2Cys6 transcription factor [Colletotrichum scovillei]KAG7041880.1 Zn(II)2Cys6 transcription factor [Colletotrichum scovillei]KAG7061910.1 Zn(II)2Cys6 transcription factor [Colletotrichum scovillei]